MDVRRTGQVRRVAALLSLLTVLVLTACGWEGTGVLKGKTYSPAYDSTSIICAGYNAQSICTVWVPSTTHISESWNLKIRDENGDDHTVGVAKPFWDSVQVGQTVTIRND